MLDDDLKYKRLCASPPTRKNIYKQTPNFGASPRAPPPPPPHQKIKKKKNKKIPPPHEVY